MATLLHPDESSADSAPQTEIKDHVVKALRSIGSSNTPALVEGGGRAGGRRGVKVHLLADTSVGGAKTNNTKGPVSQKGAELPHAALVFLLLPPPPSPPLPPPSTGR